ncbi:MAG: glycosyltransferase family 4 protein [Synechococcaceae cyanobacterium ELA263]
MRIAFLDSWLQDAANGSGTAVAIGGLARSLIERGHQVERLAPLGPWPRSLLLRRLWFNLTLPRRLGRGRYDLVVGFDIDGVRLSGRPGLAYACSIKGVLAEEAGCERGWPRLMLWSLSRLERLNARRAPLVLSTSRYCCERIQAHYGVATERLALVPEGIDLSLWSPSTDPGALAQLDAARDPCTVLCVARQYPRKRVTDLIAAFPLVLAQRPEARLVVIGDGPEHGALRQQLADLGIGSSVQLLGALASDQEVRAWYRRASIFCLPSIQEGFGIVFLEAMASGLPVVSTTATAIPEVVPHGEAGLLVPPRDPPALAAAILSLLGDAALQQRLRAFGRRHAGRYSWDRVAALFLLAMERLHP